MRCTALVVLLLAGAAGAAGAQTRPDSTWIKANERMGRPLSTVTTLRCTAGAGHSTEWDTGKPVSKAGHFGKDGDWTFDRIDRKAGTARLIGNVGAEDIRIIDTPRALHFIEVTGGGNVNVTTVFATRVQGMGFDSFAYVHSRHQDIGVPGHFASLISSQYHGTCRALMP
jgi:hypothetical protein